MKRRSKVVQDRIGTELINDLEAKLNGDVGNDNLRVTEGLSASDQVEGPNRSPQSPTIFTKINAAAREVFQRNQTKADFKAGKLK